MRGSGLGARASRSEVRQVLMVTEVTVAVIAVTVTVWQCCSGWYDVGLGFQGPRFENPTCSVPLESHPGRDPRIFEPARLRTATHADAPRSLNPRSILKRASY